MTIDARVELFHTGIWNTITADVRYRQGIEIDYGQPDWTSDADPTTCSLTLDNTAAKYSPEDPNSALFGKIDLGTKLRVRIGDPQVAMDLPGRSGSYASTPDVAALDIVGDIDVRIEITPDSWRPAAAQVLASKYQISGDNRSWVFRLHDSGTLIFSWSPDGTFASLLSPASSVAIPVGTERLAVRVTLDVADGAGNFVTRFFTAPSLAGPWTQLGAAVTTAGSTSIFSGASPVEVGAGNGGAVVFTGGATFSGRVHAFELRNGIDGTVVANPDFTAREPGSGGGFNDAAGRVWTLNGQATITDPSLRAAVRVTAWRPAWDETANEKRMSVEAAGVLHRLGQGQEPIRSSLFRDLSAKADVVAYWPLEDGGDTAAFASGLSDDSTVLRAFGEVDPASFSGFVASSPIPTVDAGYIKGNMPGYAGAANQRLFFLVHVPTAGVAGDRVLMLCTTGNPYTRWDIVVQSGGDVFFRAFDAEDVLLFSTDAFGSNINGQLNMMSLWLFQDGADIDWQVSTFEVGSSVALAHEFGTLAGRTFDRFRTVQLGTTVDVAGTAYGHVGVLNDDVHSIWDLIGSSLIGWSGERAGDRLVRLADEENIALRIIGDTADTEKLGPQEPTQLLDLLGDAPAVDLGPLSERRDAEGLLYRARTDLYNQGPALTLNMSNGVIVNPFDPPLDTQGVRNDITVSRTDGSSYRTVQETGPLSILEPPNGIGGRYKDSPTLNVATDGQLPDQAGWRLHLGTVAGHRIASLEIVMERHPELQQAVLELQLGDLIRISNPPAGLPPGPLDLIALGWSEHITPHTWRITINCSPASPWTVAVRDDATLAKRDTAGSELSVGLTLTAPGGGVLITSGPFWTTAAGDFPFDVYVGGERMTVTAIGAPSGNSQFFTLTRSVNGIVKAHSAGAPVRLWQPAVRAL